MKKNNRTYLVLAILIIVLALVFLAAGGGGVNPAPSGQVFSNDISTGTAPSLEKSPDYYLQKEAELQQRLAANEENSSAHEEIAAVYENLHTLITTGGFNESAAYHKRRAAELRAAGK